MVLKTTIDDSIKQEGAFKCDQYFTFDFNLNRRLSDKELTLIEQQVNQLINKKHRVFTKLMTLEQANKASVIGHFDHVYKKINQKLRVVHIGDINKELCGGTHVKNTSEIEQFKIINYDHRSANS
jgi:alanyl-tRNA synthetase